MISPARGDHRATWMEFTRRLGSAPILADDDHAPFAPLLAGRAPVVLENGAATAWCWVTEARVSTEGSVIVPLPGATSRSACW